MDYEKLDRIYALYGYEKVQAYDKAKVYRYRQGIYFGVDIVKLEPEVDVSEIRDEYAKAGYATQVITARTCKEIEDRIFKGFFELDATKKRLLGKYANYVQKQGSNFGGNYEYIPCQYKIINGEWEDSIKVSKYEEDVVSNIVNIVNNPGSNLILIEAAAGYGKTSTVYEILKSVAGCSCHSLNPIFIEISKNRQAKIFKHVLLNEFEHTYPYLKYELIIHEMQEGKIPLIIDGFDELLYSSHSSKKDIVDEFEDVQTMLQTIGEVIRNNAKVILTTRRTAIFAGDEFFDWVIENSNNFTTTRFLLEKPRIIDWVGDDRYKELVKNGIPIQQIANPVLLSYVRNVNDAEFEICCSDRERLVSGYFERLLLREQDRQELLIEPTNQLNIFANLAKNFIEFRITSEEKSFVKELVQLENESTLRNAILKYKPTEKPSIDDLAETLANHALLDRKGTLEDKVGFINDFIFGYLIAVSICNESKAWIQKYLIDEKYVELASTAFKIRADEFKKALRDKIWIVEEILDPQTILIVDMDLCAKALHNFDGVIFGSLEITDGELTEQCQFIDCTFTDCSFSNIFFDQSSFINVTFLNCYFSNCECAANDNGVLGDRWVLGGEDYNNGFISKFTAKSTFVKAEKIEVDFERKVLEQFWLPGKDKYTPRRHTRTLYKGFEISKRSPITDAIESLASKGWLIIEGESALINKDHVGEIMYKLGRTI